MYFFIHGLQHFVCTEWQILNRQFTYANVNIYTEFIFLQRMCSLSITLAFTEYPCTQSVVMVISYWVKKYANVEMLASRLFVSASAGTRRFADGGVAQS